jgi:hypothetical protein
MRSKSGPPPTNPNWKQNSTSLRLMLDGTTSINTNVVNDCYFYVEYVAFNYQNFENNANKSMVSVFSSSTPAAALNNRTSFFASNNQQSGICTAQTVPSTNIKYWHNGTNTFPQVGDRVFQTDSSTGYNSISAAFNGYYYLYSAGGKRYYMRIFGGSANPGTPAGQVTLMTSCAIPAPTS